MARIIEITDFQAPELDVYARLTENQLLNRHEPEKGIFIAESPKVVERALDAGYTPLSLLLEKKHILGEAKEIIERCGDIPVYTAEFDVLKELTGFPLTRGVLCAMRRTSLPTVEEVCNNARRIAILENVMNPTNVGAIFRSAAALGIDAVLLTPASSNPLYRRAIRVSMGTIFQIPWTFLETEDKRKIRKKTTCILDGVNKNNDAAIDGKTCTAADTTDALTEEKTCTVISAAYISSTEDSGTDTYLKKIKELGFKTAAMALKEDSVNIDDKKLMSEDKLAIILGTEGDGLAHSTIEDCDYTVCIPMAHGVDSLNVAAASAVAFWQLGNQRSN